MKYKLILFKDGRNILVSDEESKKGEWVIFTNTNNKIITGFNKPKIAEYDYASNGLYNFKVISNVGTLPKLTYSDEVKQILRDKYGWVDAADYKLEDFEYERKKIYLETACSILDRGISLGFKAHQSITNKIFSLEDMVKIYKEGYTDCLHNKGEYRTDYLINKLQQPIQLDIEVEIEEVGGDNLENSNKKQIYYNRPKITNNSILITKILE